MKAGLYLLRGTFGAKWRQWEAVADDLRQRGDVERRIAEAIDRALVRRRGYIHHDPWIVLQFRGGSVERLQAAFDRLHEREG